MADEPHDVFEVVAGEAGSVERVQATQVTTHASHMHARYVHIDLPRQKDGKLALLVLDLRQTF